MGGASVATVEDPTALHYNPAALTNQRNDLVLFGGSMTMLDVSYTPELQGMAPQGEQASNGGPLLAPVLGAQLRVGARGAPKRWVVGIGLWNTFGGRVSFPRGPDGIKAYYTAERSLLELVTGLAYEVDDWFSIGASLRAGFGLFSVTTTASPTDAEFSGFGVTLGGSLGALLRPSDNVTLGVSYQTGMNVQASGDGTSEITADVMTPLNFKTEMRWPQSARIGIGVSPMSRLLLSAQVDWFDWSTVDELVFDLGTAGVRSEPAEFDDSIVLHLGGEFAVTNSVAVQLGWSYETNPVPESTASRVFLGGARHEIGLGASARLGKKWSLRLAGTAQLPTSLDVADNSMVYEDAGFSAQANQWPGAHESKSLSLALEASVNF